MNLKLPNTIKKPIYLDFAAATPVDSSVMKSMMTYFSEKFYNPSGLSLLSEEVHGAIEDVRAVVAKHLSARVNQIFFTSGGTEANNLAIQGLIHHHKGKGLPHIIISAIEHASIKEQCEILKNRGEVTYTEVAVSRDGLIDPRDVIQAITENTLLISIQYVSNEVGMIQPIREIARALRSYHKQNPDHGKIFFHTDAIQAVNYLDLSVERLGVDMMTISAAKIYGPKGSSALYVRDSEDLAPLILGGGQESGIRSGTESVPGIIGFGHALDLVRGDYEKESGRLVEMRDRFIEELEHEFPMIRINGSRAERIPNNIHFSFPNISGELFVVELDARGVICSTKSACSSDESGESHVLRALYPDTDHGEWGSLRFTMGRSTTYKDLDYTKHAMREVLEKYHLI